MDTTADSGAKVAEARARWAKRSKEAWIEAVIAVTVLTAIGVAGARFMLGEWPSLLWMLGTEAVFLLAAPALHRSWMRDFETDLARRRAAGLEE